MLANEECTFQVKLKPGSQRNHIQTIKDGILVIAVKAPAKENKANQALVDLLAATLEIPKRNIEIIRGLKSKNKVVKLRGISTNAATAKVFC